MAWADLRDATLVATTAGLGETVTYTPTSGATPYSLFAIFDAAGIRLGLASGVQMATVGPRLAVRLADMPAAPVRGDVWSAGGATYRVAEIEPDGHGGAELRGEKQ